MMLPAHLDVLVGGLSANGIKINCMFHWTFYGTAYRTITEQ